MERKRTPMTPKPQGFKENRKLAAIVLAVCVAFSVFVMGPVKLGNLRDEALTVFRSGVHEGYTLSVYTDIRSAAENANRLCAAAAGVLGDQDEDVLSLQAFAETALSSDAPDVMIPAFRKISALSEKVYLHAGGKEMTGAAADAAASAIASIRSCANTIEKDDYFALAADFNQERSGFPASLLSHLSGADELFTSENR